MLNHFNMSIYNVFDLEILLSNIPVESSRAISILEYSPEYFLEYSNACTSTHSINTCNLLGPYQQIQRQSLTHQSSLLISPYLVSLIFIFVFMLSSCSHLRKFLTSSIPTFCVHSLVTSCYKFVAHPLYPHNLCFVPVRIWCVHDTYGVTLFV